MTLCVVLLMCNSTQTPSALKKYLIKNQHPLQQFHLLLKIVAFNLLLKKKSAFEVIY